MVGQREERPGDAIYVVYARAGDFLELRTHNLLFTPPKHDKNNPSQIV
jgi:hypothetical protein